MAISGGLAGMVGINEVMGYRHRYYDGFSDSYGFTGIAVALLGRNHPVGVVVAALLFAVLTRGGVPVDAFTQHVTKDIVQILQATIILFVAAEAFFREPILRLRKGLPPSLKLRRTAVALAEAGRRDKRWLTSSRSR